ncbi:MAG: TMEM175 family protein [Dokdonella sp.]
MNPPLNATDGRFRHRGLAVTRLETFVDAAFAFSLTLLVIFFDSVPHSVDELRAALRHVPTFVVCFVLLALFWNSHNRWSRRFGLEDATSTILSLGFVLVMMIYVYPLRMVIGSGLAVITDGWVPFTISLNPSRALLDVQTMFIVYALGFAALSCILWQLNQHALRCADALQLDAGERFETENEIGVQRILTTSGGVSLLVSAALLAWFPPDSRLGGWLVGLPGWTYMLIGPAIGFYLAHRARLRGSALVSSFPATANTIAHSADAVAPDR